VVIGVKEAAAYLGVSVDTIYRNADGELPAFKVGNQWRFRLDELDAWMKKEGRRGVNRG
jgi:excisionase family DNA binding protein